MRIVASVCVRARARACSFSASRIVCHLLGSYEWLERPLISCEWLLSSSYDTSRHRLTGFPLSHGLCHPIFSCAGGALGDCEWLTRITDHGDQMVFLPSCSLRSLNSLTFFWAGATTLPSRLLGDSYREREGNAAMPLLVYTDMSMRPCMWRLSSSIVKEALIRGCR